MKAPAARGLIGMTDSDAAFAIDRETRRTDGMKPDLKEVIASLV